ncbi:putative DNA-binding transcriptional regulator AlpA [Paraburkholderia atlantica]|uniref:helix-turn-helix transcriptional regulator n=1 Tax=Paraburkholderia atlantica TaxID=2654982 RepID=UPI003D263DCD
MEVPETPREARAAIVMGLAARGIEPALSTHEAAIALGLQPQTLRKWASQESGPLRPVRVGRRLAWSAADVRALLAGGVERSDKVDLPARAMRKGAKGTP